MPDTSTLARRNMPDTSTLARSRDPASITKPIPLLAFVGAIVEAIIAIVAGFARGSPAFPILATALLVLPLVLIWVIHNLITKHHDKLYAPSDFANPTDFVELIKSSSGKIRALASNDHRNIFLPFRHESPLSQTDQAAIRQHVAQLEPILENMDPRDLAVLHSWYNSIERHDFAILCMDIAVAKGDATSRNFAYRSASLRKLGRVVEAKHSALLAVELDAENPDAHYNLAKAYAILGHIDKAHASAERVYHLPAPEHSKKLREYFALTFAK